MRKQKIILFPYVIIFNFFGGNLFCYIELLKHYETALNDPSIFRVNLSFGLYNTKLYFSQGLLKLYNMWY